jgi:hypothetical protein
VSCAGRDYLCCRKFSMGEWWWAGEMGTGRQETSTINAREKWEVYLFLGALAGCAQGSETFQH